MAIKVYKPTTPGHRGMSVIDYSDLSKVVLSLDMLFGRLEIFPMLVLFSRRAWSRTL